MALLGNQERLAVLIEANTRQYNAAMRQVESRTRQTMGRSTAAVRSLDAQMKSAAVTARRFMGLFGVTLGFAGIRSLINDLDELGKQARRTGIDVESLQALMHGARLAGASDAAMERGLQRLNEEIAKASQGTTELGRLLEANGVSIRDANGDLRNTKDLFHDIADLVANARNHQEGARIAQLAMGRSARELLPILQGGAEALRQSEQAARDAGLVIDREIIEKAERFNDAWATAWTRFRAGAITAIDAAAQRLRSFIDAANEMFPLLRQLDDAVFGRGGGAGGPLELTVTNPRRSTVIPGGGGGRSSGGRSGPVNILSDMNRELQRTNELADAAGRSLIGMFDQVIFGAGSFEDALRSVVRQFANMSLQASLLGTGPLAGLFGTGASGGLMGSLFAGGFAGGGRIPAGQFGLVGERGPEFISGPANITPMGGGVQVNIINQSGAEVSQRRRRGPGGRETVDIIVGAVNDAMARGGFDQSLSGRFNLRPAVAGRVRG